MKTIRELLDNKPSRAIEMMLKGLLDENRPFEIDMGTFGRDEGNVCFGCAATCASFEIYREADLEFNVDTYARYKGSFNREVLKFEEAIDMFRWGQATPLFQFFELEPYSGEIRKLKREIEELNLNMATINWRDQIPKVEEAIALLKEAGI